MEHRSECNRKRTSQQNRSCSAQGMQLEQNASILTLPMIGLFVCLSSTRWQEIGPHQILTFHQSRPLLDDTIRKCYTSLLEVLHIWVEFGQPGEVSKRRGHGLNGQVQPRGGKMCTKVLMLKY
eukprot:EG_transcript_36143